MGRGYCHGCVWASLNPYSFFCQQCSEFTWECPLPSPSPALQGGPPSPGHRCWTPPTPSRLVQKWGHAPNLARESGPGLLFKFLGKEQLCPVELDSQRAWAWRSGWSSCWEPENLNPCGRGRQGERGQGLRTWIQTILK